MRTAAVILNWNTRDYLRRWLPGLLESRADIWVADSASDDGSLEMLAEEFPSVRTIPLDANYGFTGGYNRAMARVLEHGGYDYLVLVNSDIDADRGWLEPLEEWMDGHPECGVCGPKLLALTPSFERGTRFEYAGAAGGLLDRFGYPFCRGRVLKRTEEDTGQYDSPAGVFWMSGACMMTRASLWRELGGLDERFFAHMEEIDYCWRAHLAGWKVDCVPASRVWHLGGGTLPQTSPFKLKLNFRNNLLLLDNNLEATFRAKGQGFPVLRARLRIFFRMVLDGCSALAYLLGGRPDCFRSVLEAHGEYRNLRRKASPAISVSASFDGLLPINILPAALLHGRGIFKHLRDHEHSHCRRG